MGWTETYAKFYKKGKIDRKAEVDDMFNRDTSHYEVLKSRMVGSTYYGAVKHKEKDIVFAVVVLTKVDGCYFAYKDMDETCMPYKFDCPKSILDLLTETDNEYANEWRKKCRERLEMPKLSKLPIGTRIKFILPFDTYYNPKGSIIILTKAKYHNTTAWYFGSCRWTRGLVKNIELNVQYEILE